MPVYVVKLFKHLGQAHKRDSSRNAARNRKWEEAASRGMVWGGRVPQLGQKKRWTEYFVACCATRVALRIEIILGDGSGCAIISDCPNIECMCVCVCVVVSPSPLPTRLSQRPNSSVIVAQPSTLTAKSGRNRRPTRLFSSHPNTPLRIRVRFRRNWIRVVSSCDATLRYTSAYLHYRMKSSS